MGWLRMPHGCMPNMLDKTLEFEPTEGPPIAPMWRNMPPYADSIRQCDERQVHCGTKFLGKQSNNPAMLESIEIFIVQVLKNVALYHIE